MLAVDHKIPQSWGGTDDLDNLQPLCEECNHGKRDLFSSHDEYTDEIRMAVGYDEPHRRIGELLKAFDGGWVRGELVAVVASAVQFQEDWQKRTRELRTLGWEIETRRRRDADGRVRAEYRARSWQPWPDGSIAAEIKRLERVKRQRTER